MPSLEIWDVMMRAFILAQSAGYDVNMIETLDDKIEVSAVRDGKEFALYLDRTIKLIEVMEVDVSAKESSLAACLGFLAA